MNEGRVRLGDFYSPQKKVFTVLSCEKLTLNAKRVSSDHIILSPTSQLCHVGPEFVAHGRLCA